MNSLQFLEHQSGLIQTPLDGTTTTITGTNTTAITSSNSNSTKTQIKSNQTIQALRALRDSNPSLSNKLNYHRSKTTNSNTAVDAIDGDNDDTCIEYWNSIQEIVMLDETDHSITGLNLGALY